MALIPKDSFLWPYLQPEIQQLILDGEALLQFARRQGDRMGISDYSFLVFPFAKAYEGFLKKFFLDIGAIKYDEYYGDEIRIGRILNPHYQHELDNVFAKMCSHSTERGGLVEKLWEIWKKGRNLIFHYFPHNFKRLDFKQAIEVIDDIIYAMQLAVKQCDLNNP